MAINPSPQMEIPRISVLTSTPAEVFSALSTVGFIHLDLEGTGLSQKDVDRAFELSSLIHSMPRPERAPFTELANGNGYLKMRGSLDERTSKTDLKEPYVWGVFDSGAGETATTQVLPPVVAGFRQEFADFDNKCFQATLKVLDLLSVAFGVSAGCTTNLSVFGLSERADRRARWCSSPRTSFGALIRILAPTALPF